MKTIVDRIEAETRGDIARVFSASDVRIGRDDLRELLTLAREALAAREREEAPHVCPGCLAIGEEPCAPGCVDAEMEAEARAHVEGERVEDADPEPCPHESRAGELSRYPGARTCTLAPWQHGAVVTRCATCPWR
jgi:hypothetical protein